MGQLEDIALKVQDAIGEEGLVIKLHSDRKGLSVIMTATRLCADAKCGKVFTLKRKDQVYCSEKCRNRVAAREYRQRKRQKVGNRKVM